MTHICLECGLEHAVDEPVAELAEEAVAADAAVTIAEIEASRDVELAKINVKSEEMWRDQELAKLQGRLTGIEETLAKLAPPEPEPVPIVVPEPEPEPVVEPVAAIEPPPLADEPPKQKKRGNPFWS